MMLWAILAATAALAVEPHGDATQVERGMDDAAHRPYWVLKANGESARLKVRVKCDPSRTTYLTLRLPGNGGGHILYGCDENGKGYPPWDLLDESGLWEVDPGSWFYETIALPTEYTRGKLSTTVYLGANGVPSRRIYGIYTHTNPMFKPTAEDDPGVVRKPYAYPRFKPIKKELVAQAKAKLLDVMSEQCDIVMRAQLWAPDWREKVEKGEWPADMVGGFDIGWRKKDDGTIDLEDCKNGFTRHYASFNNQGPFLYSACMAFAYHTPGCRQYHDPVVLERIALSLDFARRAQSVNGNYWNAWAKDRWVGGPNRMWSSGTPLEGAGERGIGHAFIMTGKAMKAAGLLDQLVDDDCNPVTPLVPRRKAYHDLFKAGMDYMRRGGHAPNQECYQIDAFLMYRSALKKLGAEAGDFDTVPESNVVQRLRNACGAVKDGEFTWVSKGGIPLEWGGYSIEYNREQEDMYYRFYKFTGYDFLRERAEVTGTALATLMFPDFTEDGKGCGMLAPAFLNHRHRNILRGDGYGANYYLAYERHNPYHIRLLQLAYMDFSEESINRMGPCRGGNWFPTAAYGVMTGTRLTIRMLEALSDPKSPLCADVHLPMESGQPDFVWSDPHSKIMCFKRGETRAFLSFDRGAKDLVLIDLETPEFRQFIRAKADNGVLKLGRWTVTLTSATP